MKKLSKKKPSLKKILDHGLPQGKTEEQLCNDFHARLAAHKTSQALSSSRIKFYETTGILCFAALVVVAVFNHNYAASLCLIPDVWAMYKLFKMM